MILLIRKRTLLSAWLLICLGCLSAVFWSGSRQASVPVLSAEQESGPALQAVVIDPGHGGQDGGAVAGDGTEESRINLAISLQLEQLLRFAGVRTELTRREDVMVCDPGLKTMRQRKVSDLHNRASFVNGIPNAVLLSIHQNSLPSSPVTQSAEKSLSMPSTVNTVPGMGLESSASILVTVSRGIFRFSNTRF